VVGVQVRQQHLDVVGIGVSLQRAEHAAAEVDHQWRGVGRGEEISGRRRIRPGNATGATEHGDSHAH
jgi:hypothetical protein